jgi:hypothetical protein
MKREIATAGGHGAAVVNDNLIMTGSAASPLRRVLRAPFTKRAWAELGYTLATLPLAFAAVTFTVAMIRERTAVGGLHVWPAEVRRGGPLPRT